MAGEGVYYSPATGRFHDFQTGRFVSTDEGTRSLIRDDVTERFIDARGRTVPQDVIDRQSFRSRDLIARDQEGRPFISATVKSRVVDALVASSGTMAPNQDIMVRTVVVTPDGATHVFYYPGKLGQNVDPDDILDRAAKEARAKLMDGRNTTGRNYQITTNDVKNSTISSQYIQRTTTLR